MVAHGVLLHGAVLVDGSKIAWPLFDGDVRHPCPVSRNRNAELKCGKKTKSYEIVTLQLPAKCMQIRTSDVKVGTRHLCRYTTDAILPVF